MSSQFPPSRKRLRPPTAAARSSARRVAVREVFEGETVWEGEVLVFNLFGHPTAFTCYAWSVDQQVTAVLHEEPVNSPQTAVRAALVEKHRSGSHS